MTDGVLKLAITFLFCFVLLLLLFPFSVKRVVSIRIISIDHCKSSLGFLTYF